MPDECRRLAARRLCPGASGLPPRPAPEQADVIVLNTCVVRQSAEDKAYGRLTSLRPSSAAPRPGDQPDGLPGGRKGHEQLQKRFPVCGRFLASLRPRSAGCIPGRMSARPEVPLSALRHDGCAITC
jgi:hypothetical protein